MMQPIKTPVWTLNVRETKLLAAPRIDGITGPVVPLFVDGGGHLLPIGRAIL